MKIDRERFLVLVATLSTGVMIAPGCISAQSSRTLVIKETQDPTPVPVASVSSAVPTTTSVEPMPVAEPAPLVGLPVAASTDAGKESPDPYKGTPIKAQSCNPALNNAGAPHACSLKAPGPTCESFSDTKQECPTLNKLLKPRVAAAAIDCMNRRSGTKDICEFNVSSICAYEALESACLDPAAKTACNKVMTRCGGGPKDNYNKMMRDACEAGVSGIADAKRAKFISCITEFCRFEVCLTTL